MLLIFYYFKVFVLWSSLRNNYRLEHKVRKLDKKEKQWQEPRWRLLL